MQVDVMEDGYLEGGLFSLTSMKGKKDLEVVEYASLDDGGSMVLPPLVVLGLRKPPLRPPLCLIPCALLLIHGLKRRFYYHVVSVSRL